MTKIKTLSFEGETIYCGVDIHKKNWKVNIRNSHMELEHFSQNADPDCLASHVQKSYPGANIKVAYEAGFSGFWPCRKLQAAGLIVW